MPTPKVGNVPFKEAINFLQGKLQIPTKHWDDLNGAAHAKGFTVAGAIKAELLNGFFHSILAIKKQGGTINDFEKDFDYLVQQYGWSYKGTRGWRTRVIFNNNMRSASMAGRWQQLQRTKRFQPYLQYLTAGDTHVRDEHQEWNGTILHVDHVFWDTHYPLNGWGCRCYIRSFSKAQLKRRNLKVSSDPKISIDSNTNTPKGIDIGWDYNVGKAWLAPDISLGQKLLEMPKNLRDQALRNVSKLTPHLQKDFAPWIDQILLEKKAKGLIKTVGYFSPEIINSLVQKNILLSTAVVTINDSDILHLMRDSKKGIIDGKRSKKARTIDDDLLLNLPTKFNNPKAILIDKRDNVVVYVFDAKQAKESQKLVIRIGYKIKGKTVDNVRHKVETNSVRTGGLVDKISLENKSFYEVISGGL